MKTTKIEMRWLHLGGITAEDYERDDVVLVKHASSPSTYFPLTLQHREVISGDFATPWVNVEIVKEATE